MGIITYVTRPLFIKNIRVFEMETLNEFSSSLKIFILHNILLFTKWYSEEANALIPEKIMFWLLHGSHVEIVIYCGIKNLRIQDGLNEVHYITLQEAKQLINRDEIFSGFNTTKEDAFIGLMFDRESFFIRSIHIPNEALKTISSVIENDILHNTPFKLSEIYYSYFIADDNTFNNRSEIKIWIIDKCSIIDKLSTISIDIADIQSIYVNALNGTDFQKKIMTLNNKPVAVRFFKAISFALITLSLISIFAGHGIMVLRQQMMKHELDVSIDNILPQAKQLIQKANKATEKQQMVSKLRNWHKNTLNIATILEYVSGLLPDDTFLTELKISEDENGERFIDITGLSDIPTSLPIIMDASMFFYDSSLTSAMSLDSQSKKTSFSLRSKFK